MPWTRVRPGEDQRRTRQPVEEQRPPRPPEPPRPDYGRPPERERPPERDRPPERRPPERDREPPPERERPEYDRPSEHDRPPERDRPAERERPEYERVAERERPPERERPTERDPRAATAPSTASASSSVDVADPEQALAAIRVSYDHSTLHEVPENLHELQRIRDALGAKIGQASDNPGRARLLGLRSVVNRLLGDLNAAISDAKQALVHAEATSQLRRVSLAQARLANALLRLGQLDEADRLFAQANSSELPDRLRAAIHHSAGRCAFEQDRYIEACQHFEKALELRKDGDPDLVSAIEVALDALFGRVAERGWGPYPRSRDEILLSHLPPAPTFDERADRWGYRDASGGWPIPPQYAEVQPFHDSVAWVRPVGLQTWGLIDEGGRVLIEPRSGYLGVGGFSDGLAWVSRDGQAGWVAIDWTNRVVITGGFDDVRPFRRGIAIACKAGKWGAVENSGRLAVQFAFDAFTTGLADGRYVDGFTDEGLAIVEVGSRKGVIDRTGRVLVPIAYPTLVIHPVAFLFIDANQRWGAFARDGSTLVNPVHPSRKGVTDEIDQRLSDTRPMI